MNTRRQIVFGIAITFLLVVAIYSALQPRDPYQGLTLTQETILTDEEQDYVKNRIAVTRSAIDARTEENQDLDLYLSLAWDYTTIGDLVGARETYEEYFAYNAINYTAWSNYGFILKQMGDTQGAEEAYLTALQLNATEANYRNYITMLQENYEAPARDADILAALEDGVKNVGQTSYFMVTLAQYYLDHGDCQAAFDHYEAAIDLEPDIPAIVDDYNLAKASCT